MKYTSSLVIDSLSDYARPKETGVAFLFSNTCTRNTLPVVNTTTTVLHTSKITRLLHIFCSYAIALVFRNVRTLRALEFRCLTRTGNHQHNRSYWAGASSFGDITIDQREAFLKSQNGITVTPTSGFDVKLKDRYFFLTVPHVFICINALDECLPKCLLKLLKSLRDPLGRECSSSKDPIWREFPHLEQTLRRRWSCITSSSVRGRREVSMISILATGNYGLFYLE